MKSTEERIEILEGFLQDSLGEIPSWYKKFKNQWDDYKSGKDVVIGYHNRYVADNGYFDNKLWGILPPDLYY